ncbi:IS21-like element helper ATPase IstB [Alkaliphilus hydrothermalis]|uniref:DNA replication protein DnaC n=1 Tax=Alkaliphilus hydrothermalis TaxID=1482730 RepID=A0ABS2NUA5_9FIRM|nr:IS21-like element helper ATPase IstB [Alkaliphilus hydrothermalis]MBM7616352.1 DNA replication protein DnaC [Alkaliphilus hydrothermalis]
MNVKEGISIDNVYLENLLKKFKLLDIRDKYEEEIQLAIEKNLSYREFLANLLMIEEMGKKERLKMRNVKAANFESLKTLDQFDFSFPKTINMAKIKDLQTLTFLEKKENVILIGPPGVGKSHIATSLGIRACEEGKKVLFIPATRLIDELDAAYERKTLKQAFKRLSKIDLLIVDELGHMKLDKEKESIFFQLIRQRYEKNSLIITTNLPLGSWDEIFTSKLAATAILDRLVHHCHIISITGDSYRVKGQN